MDEQLAELLGREIPKKSRRNAVPNGVERTAEGQRTSYHLDQLHRALDRAARDNTKDFTEIVQLAYTAGRVGRRATPRGNEVALVSRVLEALFDSKSLDHDDLRKIFVIASALISRPDDRAKFRKFLLRETLNGNFDPEGQNGGLSQRKCAAIVRLADEKLYRAALSTRLEQIKRQKAATTIKSTARRRAVRALVRDAYSELTKRASPVSIHANRLDATDLALIGQWSKRPPQNGMSFELLGKLLPDTEVTRLCSARLAEKAAIQYLRKCVGEATDISIGQVTQSGSDWSTHDIVSGDNAYDVKNARRSFSSPSSYSEYCVPEFKLARGVGKEVTVVGVLSDYLTAAELAHNQVGCCSILGTVTRSEITDLQKWIEETYSDILETPALADMGFLPGWIFEHPDFQYPNRSQGLQRCIQALNDCDEKALRAHRWLVTLAGSTDCRPAKVFSSLDNEMYRRLLEVRSRLGYSRRSLFALILFETLTAARRDDNDYRPAKWRPWIFAPVNIDRDSGCHPLGLQDSERYIDSLISTLDELWALARDRLSQFANFRLSHPSILQGQEEDGTWTTIIAYCGGWRRHPVVARCGKNPIYLGQSETCPECRRLACPDCGYCTGRCSMNSRRQAELAGDCGLA